MPPIISVNHYVDPARGGLRAPDPPKPEGEERAAETRSPRKPTKQDPRPIPLFHAYVSKRRGLL